VDCLCWGEHRGWCEPAARLAPASMLMPRAQPSGEGGEAGVVCAIRVRLRPEPRRFNTRLLHTLVSAYACLATNKHLTWSTLQAAATTQ
jgi:hypothetical protein